MDGVLWQGNTPMPGLVGFFDTLRALDIPFVLATNNAAKTIGQYVERLADFGVTVEPQQILTSAEATATYLAERYEPGTNAYVVGDRGLRDGLADRGFRILSPGDVRDGQTAPLVVVGYTPHACYDDLAMGALLIHKGAMFIGSNPDPSIPSELGPMPGAGALQAFIRTTTGVDPVLVGKPGPILFTEAVRRLDADTATTAMVGDRLTTDIYGAKAVGLLAVLVLSGISTREEAEASAVKPDYIFADITELAQYLATNGHAPT